MSRQLTGYNTSLILRNLAVQQRAEAKSNNQPTKEIEGIQVLW